MENPPIHPETQLGAVALTIADTARALKFYEGFLGLRVLDYTGGSVALGTVETTFAPARGRFPSVIASAPQGREAISKVHLCNQ